MHTDCDNIVSQVRPHSPHDDSVAAMLDRKIVESQNKDDRDGYIFWRNHLHLHMWEGNEYILCSRGIEAGIANVCGRCTRRTKYIRELSARPNLEIYLSRLVEERKNITKNIIILPVPECSFTQFDPGKSLSLYKEKANHGAKDMEYSPGKSLPPDTEKLNSAR